MSDSQRPTSASSPRLSTLAATNTVAASAEAPKPSKMKFTPNLSGASAQRTRGQKSENPLSALSMSRASEAAPSTSVNNANSTTQPTRPPPPPSSNPIPAASARSKVAFQAPAPSSAVSKRAPREESSGGVVKADVKPSSGSASGSGSSSGKFGDSKKESGHSSHSVNEFTESRQYEDLSKYAPVILTSDAKKLKASEDIKMDGRSSMLPDSILVQLPDECEARTLFALPTDGSTDRSVSSIDPSPLMLVQLPAHLPSQPYTIPSWAAAAQPVENTANVGNEMNEDETAEVQVTAQPNNKPYMDRLAQEMYQFEHAANLQKLPSGYCGTLVITRSGRVKLELGSVLFDVTSGTNGLVHQELFHVNVNAQDDESSGTLSSLSDIRRKMVVSLPLDELSCETQLNA